MQEFAVIFDFNGTMLFDTQIQYHAWDKLAKETLGHGIDQEEFLRSVNGRTSHETVEYFWGNRLCVEQKQALIDQKRKNYKEYCLTHPEEFRLADGIPEVLDLLKQRDIPFTIATSSNPQSVDFYFEYLNLGKWFRREHIVCSDKNFPGKPAPDIYRYAARDLGIAPQNCIVVEDAIAGAYAARGADIGYIVIIDPEMSGFVWVGDQVDYIIHDYKQFYELLCNIMHAYEIEK
ncbi:MAG: HAD family phosphatase [Clostridia bacterium]|nr:HAD family phosphatase [Clostridia bacterium]